MTALATLSPLARSAVQLEAFGEITPLGRPGGQGRVHRPARTPPELGAAPVVVKLYHRPASAAAAQCLDAMVAWGWSLPAEERKRLLRLAAWPLCTIYSGVMPVGIAMQDVSARFVAPFAMPSGRRERVLLGLEHLLGADDYLELRGLNVRLNTSTRTWVAERFSEALAYLHRHAIVVSDIAPSNLLVSFGAGGPSVCLIDCDSMVFRGRQALEPVETGDWNMPAAFQEAPRTRAADAYKLALMVLRLYARAHDARATGPHLRYIPAELRRLLDRGLGPAAANRPPAGEWQRALRELLLRGHLDERYPGPAPRPRAPRAAPAIARDPSPSPRPRAAVPAVAAPLPAPATPTWLRPAVVAMWLIAGTAVLALILSRLFAAALPSASGGAPANGAPVIGQYVPQSAGAGSGYYAPAGSGAGYYAPQGAGPGSDSR